MRQKSYVRAASRSSSYYGETERRSRKAVNLVFAFIALIALSVTVFMFFKYREISLKREDAASKLSLAKEETEKLGEKRRTMNTELENLTSEIDKLRIEYDSLEQ